MTFNLRSTVTVFGTGFLILSLLLLGLNNLGTQDIWYDEAQQFWMSIGGNGHAKPNTPVAGLPEVIYQNQVANMDPGGYTLIMHFWMQVSTDLSWLRFFSYCWFVLGVACLGFLGWEWTRSWHVALFASSVILFSESILYFCTEVRPYSMEFAGVALISLMLVRWVELPSYGRLLALSLTSCIFLTSRYSIAFVVIAATFCVLLNITVFQAGKSWPWKVRQLAVFLFPPMLMSAAILDLTLLDQIRMRGGLSTSGMLAPDYVADFVLKGKSMSSALSLISSNFSNPFTYPILLGSLVMLLPSRVSWIGNNFASDKCSLIIYQLGMMTLLVSVLGSMLGIYPWNINVKWSLYLIPVSSIVLVRLVADVYQGTRLKEKDTANSGPRSIPGLIGIVSIIIAVAGSINAATYHRDPIYINLGPIATYLSGVPLEDDSVYVEPYEYVSIRYMHEYGPYTGDPRYPDQYRFSNCELDSPKPDNCQEFIISPKSPRDVSAVYTSISLAEPSGDMPSGLHKIAQQPGCE